MSRSLYYVFVFTNQCELEVSRFLYYVFVYYNQCELRSGLSGLQLNFLPCCFESVKSGSWMWSQREVGDLPTGRVGTFKWVTEACVDGPGGLGW